MVGDAQGRGALGIGIEAGGVDQDLAPQGLAGAGLELEIGIDALAFPGGRQIYVPGYVIKGEAGIRIQGYARQGMGGCLATIADDGEAVVHGLVAATLDLETEEMVDEGRFTRREGAQHRDQGPPGNLGGEGFVRGHQAHGLRHFVQGAEALNRAQEDGVFLGQVGFEVFESLSDGIRGGVHWHFSLGWECWGC